MKNTQPSTRSQAKKAAPKAKGGKSRRAKKASATSAKKTATTASTSAAHETSAFDRGSDAAWLVEGDALAEQGQDALASAFHVMGCRFADQKRTREAIALAVATSAWVLVENTRPDGSQEFGESVGASIALIRSLSAFGRGAEPEAWPVPDEALAPAIDALRAGDLATAVRATRGFGDGEQWLRLFRTLAVLEHPFVEPDFVDREIQNLAGHVDLTDVLDLKSTRFSFEHVVITNSTQGVDGRLLDGAPPLREAFVKLALELDEIEPDEIDEEEIEEIISDAAQWATLSPFDAISELFSMRASNEGNPVRVGKSKEQVRDCLERFGRCLGGARSESDFPYFIMRFEKALVVLHLIY
ncbi:MAG: hypothetical protein JNM17_19770 [Archangium sp.]|nr:hypothetical protein [Archangium sp.]